MKKIRILHYQDPLGEIEEENRQFLRNLKQSNLDFNNCKIKQTSYLDEMKNLYSYDYVFFDYGGLGLGLGTSLLLDEHERFFIKAVQDNPNTIFCIISNLPDHYINKDMQENYPNLFIGFKDFLENTNDII